MKKFFCFEVRFGRRLIRAARFRGAIPAGLACAAVLLAAAFFFSACESKPVPAPEIEPAPVPVLVFKGVEADSPERFTLLFSLETEKPVPPGGRAKIASWQAEINGRQAESGFSLEPPPGESFPLNAPVPLRLEMDIARLAGLGLAPEDEYRISLRADMDFSAPSLPPRKTSAVGQAVFPGVLAPDFQITSIAILRAELINTRFRVGLKIGNPNPFPIELSSFVYELYGNGKPWADGEEKNILRVEGKSSLEGHLFLIMNFIDMDRPLLDQISRLQDVNYRFSGSVEVTTGVDYLPKFSDSFDFSGYSQVLDR